MKNRIFCQFNTDTDCGEPEFTDGTLLSIHCTAAEDKIAKNFYQVSELDPCNAPLSCANLILNGDVKEYLRNYTDYRPIDEKQKEWLTV